MSLSCHRPAFRTALPLAALLALGLCAIGCERIPGRPGPGPDVPRPESELRFAALYQQNCAACHGDNGRDGAALSLANPVYVEFAKDHLQTIVSNGVPGHLMPGFAKSAGGMLTDQQVAALVEGIKQQWGGSSELAGQDPPPYASTLKGDAQHGQQAYATYCARCHGASGEGGAADDKAASSASGAAKTGSIVDASYLALLSDQNLRSITIAGRPDQGMPDWRHDAAQPMTDQQITDIVAWIASKRVADPGQPYPAHP
jgi:mono/diheme cytochrome c family protein